jgi:hypothetical protein
MLSDAYTAVPTVLTQPWRSLIWSLHFDLTIGTRLKDVQQLAVQEAA